MHDAKRIFSLENAAREAIAATVSSALDAAVEPELRSHDDFLELRFRKLPLAILVALATESRRPLVSRAAQRARERAQSIGHAVPAVFVPHITRGGAEAAERLGVGWFDQVGNAHLAGAGLLIHVEGRKPARRPSGRSASPFAPRSSRVVRTLLVHAERAWTQKELIEETELAQGTVSRTLSRLRDLDLLAQDDNRYRLPRPGELLDAWKDEYEYRRHEIVPAHLTGGGIGLARKVVGRLRSQGVQSALTGFPAAWLYDEFAQFRLVSVFVEGSPVHAAELAELRIEERGANVHLIRPLDRGVFYESSILADVTCAHPVQTYLDLGGLPERSDEAAEHLRHDWIRF
jgi:hypothetical protein